MTGALSLATSVWSRLQMSTLNLEHGAGSGTPVAHTLRPNGPARLARASLAQREAQCQSQHDTNAASRDADVPELFHDPLQNFNVPASSCHTNGG